MAPSERSLALCVDEKSQIQTLDRTQQGLPVTFGKPAARTHDYKRNGITSPFAAPDAATDKIIGQLKRRNCSAEFPQFLKAADAAVPADMDIHLIMDNYDTHTTQKVRARFAGGSRYHAHFTPISASRLNLVERWLGQIGERRIERQAHTSVAELEQSIQHYIDTHNADPKPFVRHRTADAILASVAEAAAELL